MRRPLNGSTNNRRTNRRGGVGTGRTGHKAGMPGGGLMGICGCGENPGEYLLRTNGKICLIGIVHTCHDCGDTIGLAIDKLDKSELKDAKDGQVPELKFDYNQSGIPIIDVELVRDYFIEQGKSWFEGCKYSDGSLMDRAMLDVIFSDFIRDLFREAVERTRKHYGD